MSHSSIDPQARRRLWPWVLISFVVIAVLAVVVGIWASQRTPAGAGQPLPWLTDAGVGEPGAELGEGGLAPGCLGGEQVDAAMLARAVQEAPLTVEGAVGVAASFHRWAGSDTISVEEVEAAREAITAPDASQTVMGGFDSQISRLQAGDRGQNERYSLEEGAYLVEAADESSVTVSVAAEVYPAGGALPDHSAAVAFTMVLTDVGWQLQDVAVLRSPEDVARNGSAFAGGC